MAAGSQRTGANPWPSYAWKDTAAFTLSAKPARAGKRGGDQVITYSLKPSFEWSATPNVVKFRFTCRMTRRAPFPGVLPDRANRNDAATGERRVIQFSNRRGRP